MATASFALALILAITSRGALAASRTETRLTGWQRCVTPAAVNAPPTEGWKPAGLPHSEFSPWTGPGVTQWYRTTLKAPGILGKRVVLDLPPMLHPPQVWVANHLVNSDDLGWYSAIGDVSRWVRPEEVPLALAVRDCAATFADGITAPEGTPDSILRGKILLPVGGYKDRFGVLGEVTVRSTPAQFFDEEALRIVTETRRDRLTVQGKAQPSAGATVTLVVSGSGQKARILARVAVKADGTWRMEVPGKGLRRWSPEDPYLYTLTARLQDRQRGPRDQITPRFGFREFWVPGLNFYLNGVRRNLLATSSWPMQAVPDRPTLEVRVRAAKQTGAIAFRLHIWPSPDTVLAVADEAGLLIIDEAAVFTDGDGMYVNGDPRFWANYRRVLTGMVHRVRNHPSVIHWSLGNEILFMGNQSYQADLPKLLGELALFTNRLDSIRPVMFDADLDPDGKQTEAGGGMLGNTTSNFKLERQKPLYLGEYFWVPYGDYSPGTVFYGDAAYRNRGLDHGLAQALSWFVQSVAYRRAGVTGLSPWSAAGFDMEPNPWPLADAQRRAYVRVGAIPHQCVFRAFANRPLTLTYDLFNETMRPLALRLSVRLAGGEPGNALVSLPPGETRAVTLSIPTSFVARTQELDLFESLTSLNQRFGTTTRRVTVSPRTDLRTPGGSPIVWINQPSDFAGLRGRDPKGLAVVVVNEHVLDTDGTRSLAQLPDVIPPLGQGVMAPNQATIGTNLAADPGAVHHMTGLIDHLVKTPSLGGGRVVTMAEDATARTLVEAAGIKAEWRNRALLDEDLTGTTGLIVAGSASAWIDSGKVIAQARKSGRPMLWLGANASAFPALRDDLDLASLAAMPVASVTQPLPAIDPVNRIPEMTGLSAEEFVWTSAPQGWNNVIQRRTRRVPTVLMPAALPPPVVRLPGVQFKGAIVMVAGTTVVFDRQATVAAKLPAVPPGWDDVTLHGSGRARETLELQVAGETFVWLGRSTGTATTWMPLPAGSHVRSISFVNGPSWGGSGPLRLDSVELAGPMPYPPEVTPLARPGALILNRRGPAPVIIGTATLTGDQVNLMKAVRQVGGFAANLGLPFVAREVASGTEVCAKRFRIFDGPHNEISGGRITLRSNGTAFAPSRVASPGEYEVTISAGSTTLAGKRARVRLTIGEATLEHDVITTPVTTQRAGRMAFPAGDADLRVEFLNDGSGPGQDLHLEVLSVSFSRIKPASGGNP